MQLQEKYGFMTFFPDKFLKSGNLVLQVILQAENMSCTATFGSL